MSSNPKNNPNLSEKLYQELVKEQAAKMGVSPDELMLKIVDGKQVWVKRSEVYAQLEQQRRLAAPKKVPRSLRGEDSLIRKLEEEVRVCQQLSREMTQASILNALEASDFQASAGKTQERAHNLGMQLGDVESSIEELKGKDPVFTKAEHLLHEMKQASETGDNERINQLRVNNGDLLRRYETRRQKLEPYLDSARQYRLEIQKEYWRILMLHWKLLENGVKYHLKRLTEATADKPVDQQKKMFNICDRDARDVAEVLYNTMNELNRSAPDKNSGPNSASQQYDKLIPEMQRYMELMHALFDDLGRIHPQNQSRTRMAYLEEKNK